MKCGNRERTRDHEVWCIEGMVKTEEVGAKENWARDLPRIVGPSEGERWSMTPKNIHFHCIQHVWLWYNINKWD